MSLDLYSLQNKNILRVIGSMSGTSADGIDLAFIETDGEKIFALGNYQNFAYPSNIRDRLKSNHLNYANILELEYDISNFYVECLKKFIKNNNYSNIDVIGFHGQTIFHFPEKQGTWQIGNPHILTSQLQIPVVADFRRKDLSNGGQGAPLVPLYHQILAKMFNYPYPLAFINIGGVANISYINSNELIAFDIGPGCALVDDICQKYFKCEYDENGEIARTGKINFQIIDELLEDPYFKIKGTKSLDRNYFHEQLKVYENQLAPKDLMASLTYFTAKAIKHNIKLNNLTPSNIILCGGGSKNKYLVELLQNLLRSISIINIESEEINSQAIEAQAFGLLAVRAVKKLPSSFPNTTGVIQPTVCGVFYPV